MEIVSKHQSLAMDATIPKYTQIDESQLSKAVLKDTNCD
jgi:hypothetical protein